MEKRTLASAMFLVCSLGLLIGLLASFVSVVPDTAYGPITTFPDGSKYVHMDNSGIVAFYTGPMIGEGRMLQLNIGSEYNGLALMEEDHAAWMIGKALTP